MLILATILACTGSDKDDSAAVSPTPTVEFVSPADGATVPAGDVALSIVVTDFLLTDPAKHNEGEPEGYLQVDWTDGTTPDSVQTASTTPTITIATAGSWTLTADLFFADGDGMDESFDDFVPASITITVE